ncbi:MAG: NAD(+) diphosphatase [Termitinemataceae bacterium]
MESSQKNIFPSSQQKPGLTFLTLQTFSGSVLQVFWFEGDTFPFDRDAWDPIEMRSLLAQLKAPLLEGPAWTEVSDFLRAYHCIQWKRSSRYCGYCGSPQEDAKDELARLCPSCGRREYPRITPAVIVAVTNDANELLLAYNAHFKKSMYSLIAGFVEAGERLEDTVRREIYEEVGIQVDRIRYVASQPWPFPASLMLGFEAHYAGGELRCDGREILDARWTRPDSLPELPGAGSISRFLIDRWLSSFHLD